MQDKTSGHFQFCTEIAYKFTARADEYTLQMSIQKSISYKNPEYILNFPFSGTKTRNHRYGNSN
jgi:hypothetical protein